MPSSILRVFLVLCLSLATPLVHAESLEEKGELPEVDFETPEAFIDQNDALGSKQYVRRAILSSVIESTNKFAFDRLYLNHLMGFSAVFQKTHFAKFVTGVQGLSVGYITENGHAFEGGLELSAVSNVFGGYRYVMRPEKFSLWPFMGAGLGMEVASIKFADGPPEAESYDGMKSMLFTTLGVLVPLVDVGIKAEVRFGFYGFDRLVMSTGVGVIVFL